MSQTYNISRAYRFPRNKRAAKAVKILQKKVERNHEEAEISNELNNYIWERGAQSPPKKVTIEFEERGEKRLAFPVEQETTESTTTSSTSGEADESVLDGTVSEAKDRISEMDNPDYDKLLEMEKDGKDRKTLVEWLEGKV